MTYNFATTITETTIHKLKTLATALFLVFSSQNCELKQEPRTQATALNQPHKFHNRERRYFFLISRVSWNYSEIVTSGRIFVLTLNRASALTVEDNEQNFLLPQIIVAITKRIGLESKHHHPKRIGLESKLT